MISLLLGAVLLYVIMGAYIHLPSVLALRHRHDVLVLIIGFTIVTLIWPYVLYKVYRPASA